MSQVFLASTFFGAANLAAAIDDGIFDRGGPHHRVLLASTNSAVPESTTPLTEMPGFAAIANKFDRVVSWNLLLAPFHPSEHPSLGEPAIVSAWLRRELELDDRPVELVLESIQVKPARGLADIFVAAPITIYSDGLMSFGPTRFKLPRSVGNRIDRLVYLDLMPGVHPVLLSEFDVELVRISDSSFRNVLDQTASQDHAALAASANLSERGATALVIGQYLSSLGIVSRSDEVQLYVDLIHRMHQMGHDTVAFKPHPTAGYTGGAIESAAAERGVDVIGLTGGVAVEHLLGKWRPALVGGCFSTGLLVANRFFGLDVVSMGTERVLERLSPFANSNRVPIVLVDACLPRLDRDGACAPVIPAEDAPQLQRLVDTMAFVMQPEIHEDRRDAVSDNLRQLDPRVAARYIGDARVRLLGLQSGESSASSWRSYLRAAIMRARSRALSHPRLARAIRNSRTYCRSVAGRCVRVTTSIPRRLRRLARAN